ncbi:uncharacterized protein MELLADRAFT_102998 [Melampsora larici-populina 98AG31]|uniref:Wax synthase domain-containing protein n=1 Tax=Melampsora larici-populina (strain 98AG31 / pathotype 3-4-7) TaxID=747676 RepID=F4RA81_MELLP|nr:uncharacterized protein MELLADRAFT_102998 [Melampsora larici-populina 98AG31]EGG10431.1 hypothetical protein MELLADRAFT_102998 [Melampsora larici-populina 98AG31]
MSALISMMYESKIWNYTALPVLLIQASMLHPHYESNEMYRTIRFMLAPIIIYLTISSQHDRMFKPLEDFVHMNYALVAIPSFHVIAITLQYAYQRGPVLLNDLGKKKRSQDYNQSENSLISDESESADTTCSESTEVIKTPLKLNHNQLLQKSKYIIKSKRRLLVDSPSPSWGEIVKFSSNLITSPRGLQYVWAPPSYVCSRAPKKSIAKFVWEQTSWLILNQIGLIIEAAFAVPATQHPSGPHGYMTEVLGIPDSSLLQICSDYIGLAFYGSIGYHALTIAAACINLIELLWYTLASRLLPDEFAPAPFDTTLYPHLFNYPNFKTSITEFWSRGWHCVFRTNFVFLGSEPFGRIAKPFGPRAVRLASMMGAMLISGLMHEWGTIFVANRIDWNFEATRFFLMMGVGVAIESILKTTLGFKFSGVLGNIWVFSWFGFWGNPFMKVWLDRGVGSSGITCPCEITDWPLARFLVPLGPLLPDSVFKHVTF